MPIRSDLSIKQLTRTWDAATAQRRHEFGQLGLLTCEQARDRLRGPDSDVVARELVTLAQNGDQLAGQVLVVALLPKVVSLSRSYAGAGGLELEDTTDTLIATMWEEIHALGPHITRSVLAQIGLNTKRRHIRTWTAPSSSPYLEATHSDLPLDELLADLEGTGSTSSVADLAEVFAWARETDVLTAQDIRILATVELGLPEDRAALANELGIAADSLRRRSTRLRDKLREAVRGYITQAGSWS